MPRRFPPGGFPAGWYVMRPSTWLKPKQVVPVHFFGRDMVLYRTERGRAHVADPICPHLGANLGLGRVSGENLVCGMHGFEFGAGGECVKLAYGTRPPRKARVTHHPVQEVDGFVYSYYAPDSSAPSWKLEPLDWQDWTPLRHQRLEFIGHPQEIAENSVDIGHFKSVHHYSSSIEEHAVADAQKLTAGYRVVRPWFGPVFENLTFEVRFHVLAHGLGCSIIHADVQRTPIRIRYFVNATPIDGERTQLQIAAAIRKLPFPGLNAIVREAVLYGLRHDVTQDIPFWESKHHLVQPVLADGDGEIGEYRRWCRQFYAQPARNGWAQKPVARDAAGDAVRAGDSPSAPNT